MSPASALKHHRARVAALTRSRTADDPELVDERAKLEVASRDNRIEGLASHIAKIVDAAPPLTTAQRDRLALLLRGGAT